MGLTRPSTTYGFGALLALSTCVACQTSPSKPEPPITASADATTASNVTRAQTAAAVATEAAGVASAPPGWAVGKWAGTGTASATRLQLPNNQGVQLAWLKDKGQQFAGPIELSLTLTANGEVSGELTGALGNLKANGVWPAVGPLHLELRPAEEATNVFHGTVTVTWDERKPHGSARLRATSGDGYWLRAAELEVTRPS